MINCLDLRHPCVRVGMDLRWVSQSHGLDPVWSSSWSGANHTVYFSSQFLVYFS
jgi:hypothetical protein